MFPQFQEACFETSHLSAFFCPWNVSVRCYIHLPELIGKLDRFDLDRLQVKSVSIHFIFPSTNPDWGVKSHLWLAKTIFSCIVITQKIETSFRTIVAWIDLLFYFSGCRCVPENPGASDQPVAGAGRSCSHSSAGELREPGTMVSSPVYQVWDLKKHKAF